MDLIGTQSLPEVVMNVRKPLAFVVLLFLLFGVARLALAQASFPSGPNPHAVPTFHSIGLYWHNPGGGTGTAMVEFKKQGASEWRRGLDLWYDARNSEYRGSLVELQPGTTYDIRITRQGASGTTLTGTTWSETFNVPSDHDVTVPVGTRRIVVNPSTGPIPTFSTSGTTFTVNAPTASGSFTRISAPPGQNVIVGDPASYTCMLINHGTRHVVITGLVFQGCTRNGVHFPAGSSAAFTDNIVIDRNEFVGWGGFENDFGAGSGLADNDGAIECNYGGRPPEAKPRRIIVQANIFRDPRHGSNYWAQFAAHGHPEGPMAYYLGECGGNHVFRYNEVHADGNGNHFKDGVGGCCNDGQGGPGPDSDIYANRISHVYDDAIQAEGENRNVRIWGNYIDRTFVAIGNVPTAKGPLYVWRNISNHMASMRDPNIDSDSDLDLRKAFVKGGDNGSGERGRAYYFHNTILQAPPPQGKLRPLGAGHGLESVDGRLLNFVSKNNTWHIYRPHVGPGPDYRSIVADCDLAPGTCESNFDLYNGNILNAGPNGGVTDGESWRAGSNPHTATPTYASSDASYPSSASIPSAATGWAGDFTLKAGTPGHGQAQVLFNFNDQSFPTAPDIGAHQSGTGAMKFGRAAVPHGTPPQAVLNTSPDPASGPAPLTVTFTSGSTPGSAPFTSITLDFGDGTSLDWTADHPAAKTHQYAAGNYAATLTVTTAHGTSSSDPKPITVSCGQPPTASFTATPNSGNRPLAVNFDASASTAVSPATISSYSITYGDGGSGTGVLQSHTYQESSTFIAALVVTDSNNCQSAPATQQVTVTEPALPAFRSAAAGSTGPSIGFRAAASAATNASSLSINRPAGTAANDVMVAAIGVRPSNATIAAPAGWTLVRRVDNASGGTTSLAVFRKVATGSEPASYVWDVTGAAYATGGIQSFVNVDTANPIDVENGQATGGSLSHTTPSVTTTVPSAMVVTAHTFGTSTTWTPPAGMTEGFDTQFQPAPANSGQSIEGNYVAQATAGATGTKTATAAGGAGAEGPGATHILALRPSPALNIARPAGTAANDVMIAAIGVRPSSATIAAPAGWTLVRRVDNASGGTTSLAVFRRLAGTSEPASYAWDVSGATYAAGGIQSFVNVDTANPIDVESGQATPTSLSHATPSVTTTAPNVMVVTAHTFGTSTTWTPPSGMTEAFDAQFQPAPANSGQSIEGNYAVQATAGATGTKTATAAGAAGAAGPGATHILGLRPVAP